MSHTRVDGRVVECIVAEIATGYAARKLFPSPSEKALLAYLKQFMMPRSLGRHDSWNFAWITVAALAIFWYCEETYEICTLQHRCIHEEDSWTRLSQCYRRGVDPWEQMKRRETHALRYGVGEVPTY